MHTQQVFCMFDYILVSMVSFKGSNSGNMPVNPVMLCCDNYLYSSPASTHCVVFFWNCQGVRTSTATLSSTLLLLLAKRSWPDGGRFFGQASIWSTSTPAGGCHDGKQPLMKSVGTPTLEAAKPVDQHFWRLFDPSWDGHWSQTALLGCK